MNLPDDERSRRMITAWASAGRTNGIQCKPINEALQQLLEDETYRNSLLVHYEHTFSWEVQVYVNGKEVAHPTGRCNNAAALLDRFLDELTKALKTFGGGLMGGSSFLENSPGQSRLDVQGRAER